MTNTENTANYQRDLYAQADELDRKADTLHMSLLAPSMKEQTLRAEAARLREMARDRH